jgi:hypothetical protein
MVAVESSNPLVKIYHTTQHHRPGAVIFIMEWSSSGIYTWYIDCTSWWCHLAQWGGAMTPAATVVNWQLPWCLQVILALKQNSVWLTWNHLALMHYIVFTTHPLHPLSVQQIVTWCCMKLWLTQCDNSGQQVLNAGSTISVSLSWNLHYLLHRCCHWTVSRQSRVDPPVVETMTESYMQYILKYIPLATCFNLQKGNLLASCVFLFANNHYTL